MSKKPLKQQTFGFNYNNIKKTTTSYLDNTAKNSLLPSFKPAIFQVTDLKNLGIHYWTEEAITAIAKNSGPLASHNEFQVHYWALVARYRLKDGSIIDYCFPTVFFNYPQQVTSAHIDFELKDVSEKSQALEPVHTGIVNSILLPQLKAFQESNNITFTEILSVAMNTLHRHPTGVASFSGTDLHKNHKTDTGIVFPLKTANVTPSFSSIIYNNPAKLVRTEYRIATGNTEHADGITYKKGRCFAYVKGSVTHTSDVEKLLGIEDFNNSYTFSDQCPELPEVLKLLLNEIDYQPSVEFVDAVNVEAKSYYHTLTAFNKVASAKGKKEKSKESKTSISSMEKYYNITFKTDTEIDNMTVPELLSYIKTLESARWTEDYEFFPEEYQPHTVASLKEDVYELLLIMEDEMVLDLKSPYNDILDDMYEDEILPFNKHVADPNITPAAMRKELLLSGFTFDEIDTLSPAEIEYYYETFITN